MRGMSGDVSHNMKTKFSSSRSLRLYQQRKRHKRLLRQKLRLFAYQLRQLSEAMRYPAVLTMVVLWIIGNAVYSVSHQTPDISLSHFISSHRLTSWSVDLVQLRGIYLPAAQWLEHVERLCARYHARRRLCGRHAAHLAPCP